MVDHNVKKVSLCWPDGTENSFEVGKNEVTKILIDGSQVVLEIGDQNLQYKIRVYGNVAYVAEDNGRISTSMSR